MGEPVGTWITSTAYSSAGWMPGASCCDFRRRICFTCGRVRRLNEICSACVRRSVSLSRARAWRGQHGALSRSHSSPAVTFRFTIAPFLLCDWPPWPASSAARRYSCKLASAPAAN